MAQNINAKGRDWADNKLCSVGGLLAAALWMWCAGLSNLSTAICRAWREKYECVKSWNPPSRPVRLCSWLPLLLTASASCSSHSLFHHLSRVRTERLFGKQIYPLPATQLLGRSWHGLWESTGPWEKRLLSTKGPKLSSRAGGCCLCDLCLLVSMFSMRPQSSGWICS